jgi:immune inhibitor A
MKRTLLILALLVIALVPTAGAAPNASSGNDDPQLAPKEDNRPDPLSTKKAELKEQALEAKLNGKAYGKTHEVARGQFVELAREGEDPIWTVLGEFSDLKHNAIPTPDRSVDNSTIWKSDFNRASYIDMLFAEGPGVNSMRNYFIEQSSNRYTVHGDVTDWVEVPGEAWTYDDDLESPLGGNAVWYFLADSVDSWYAAQIAGGKTPSQIDAYLSQFDVWDRYDWDGDGNFNESDGYIDHMQFVHAGQGNESCVGTCDWAIWSHSWFAFFNLIDVAGPSPEFLEGGVQIGESAFWVNKYTIQPENGGVGVFAHEYSHDLGIPDLYDYTGENSTGFWTLMSSGSNLGGDNPDIGSKPSHLGAWEKFQLDWLNYEVAYAGKTSSHKLGPMETTTKQAQGLFVVLPKKSVVSNVGAAYEGSYYYYSGAGDKLDYVMYKPFNLAAGATLQAKVKYNIEIDWDYAYLVYSTNGGATWTPIETNRSTTTSPNGQNFGFGITGASGGWVDLTANLPEGNVLLGFRYWTDDNTGGFGFMMDNILVTGYDLDGAETDAGWTYRPTTGFHVTNGVESKLFNNYYVAEFRQYRGYDKSLRYAYNFGFLNNPALQDWVEKFPYQDGMLINYWDTSFPNNNVGANCAAGRCGGLLLTVDAHPTAMIRADGGVWRGRMQSYDATFSLDRTEPITLNWLSEPSYHPSLPAVSVFDDRLSYYDPLNPMGSVITPVTGTQIRIKSYSAQGNFMQIEVRPAK